MLFFPTSPFVKTISRFPMLHSAKIKRDAGKDQVTPKHIAFEQLGMRRIDITGLVKPKCQRRDLFFELNAQHTHLVWRGNNIPLHIRMRTPFPRCTLQPLQQAYPGVEVFSLTEVPSSPDNTTPLTSVIFGRLGNK